MHDELKKAIRQLVNELGEGWAKETQQQTFQEQVRIMTRMHELSEAVKKMIEERARLDLEKGLEASPLTLEREDQHINKDKIYSLTTGMNEQLNWLSTRVDRLVEALDSLYPEYNKARKQKKGSKYLKDPGGNSLKKEEVAEMNAMRKSGLLDELANQKLGLMQEGLEALKKDTADAIKKKHQLSKTTLQKLEVYEKQFKIDFAKLKADYESLWEKIEPSDIAKALPVKPYKASLPPSIDKQKLKRVGDGGKVGQGGFGSVTTLVHDGPLKETFAFKVLNAEAGNALEAEKAKAELQKEIMLYEKIGEHPNIVKCFGLTQVNGKEGMLMESLEGGDAYDNLVELNKQFKEGKISDTEYVGFMQHVMRGMMQGLAHMAKAGYSHLDVKFPNLMMTADGEIKLIDPGNSEESGLHVSSSQVPDNPIFTDPLLRKEMVAMPYQDVFSAGLALYDMSKAKIHKPTSRKDEFTFGREDYSFTFELENAGDEWMRDTANRVLKAMTAEDKKKLERLIEAEQKKLKKEMQEMDLTLKSMEKQFVNNPQQLEEARKTYRELSEESMKAYQETIAKIREEFFEKYGSPFENAYMNFLNQMMHPDPALRLTAETALNHPFLSDGLLDNEEQAKEIFWKLKPGLKPENRQAPVVGEGVSVSDPEISPVELSAEQRQALKKQAEGPLQEPAKMEKHVSKELWEIFDSLEPQLAKWKKDATPHKEETTIEGVLKQILRVPRSKQVMSSLSSSKSDSIERIISELQKMYQHAHSGKTYFDNLQQNRGLKGLELHEKTRKDLLTDMNDFLEDILNRLKTLYVLDSSWRVAFAKTTDGPVSYDRIEQQRITMEKEGKGRLMEIYQELLEQEKKARKVHSEAANLKLMAKELAKEELEAECQKFFSSALKPWLKKAQKYRDKSEISSLLKIGKTTVSWEEWPVKLSAGNNVNVLISMQNYCQDKVAYYEEQKKLSTKDKKLKGLLEDLESLCANLLVPHKEKEVIQQAVIRKIIPGDM